MGTTGLYRKALTGVVRFTLVWLLVQSASLGQTYRYTVSWTGIPIINVSIEFQSDDHVEIARYRAWTKRFVSKIYAVDNRYEIRLDRQTKRPLHYSKEIKEPGKFSRLTATYNEERQQIEFSNGTTRPWGAGESPLFASLYQVQHQAWQTGDRDTIRVEVEGIVWEVTAHCYRVDNHSPEPSLAYISVVFDRKLSGTPILDETDILTHMLPGENHTLDFTVDLSAHQVRSVQYGERPFALKAELDDER